MSSSTCLSQLKRTRSLYENDNASRTDLDAATAAADSAAAQVKSVAPRLVLARRQVGYTRLTAPVARAIAAVRAEVNENVSPGQPVEVLAAGAAPEVAFAVPEALIARVREGTRAAVVFDAIPGERFDAVVTEVGVTTTAVGTTFPVTVRLDAGAPEVTAGIDDGDQVVTARANRPAGRRHGSALGRLEIADDGPDAGRHRGEPHHRRSAVDRARRRCVRLSHDVAGRGRRLRGRGRPGC